MLGLVRSDEIKTTRIPVSREYSDCGIFFSPFSIYNHVCQRFIDQNTSLILFTFTA